MFSKSEDELRSLGAEITTREIRQQPELWQETFDSFQKQKEKIDLFLKNIYKKHNYVHVIFSGAGTSAFVGETIEPYLNKINDGNIQFSAIATTDILANPDYYFEKDVPTILVSFARSGNSPESVATVKLAEKMINSLYQMTITCAVEGKLAQFAKKDDKNLLLLQPERANDQGFAMTGSYTCMTLTALLVFDRTVAHGEFLPQIIKMAENVFTREDYIKNITDSGIKRVVYLGSAGFFGLSRESQLKILELTAGKIATMYETPLGFRHGPKSFVNEETMVIVFVSPDEYAKKYDVDLLNEVYHDHIAKHTIALTAEKLPNVEFDQFVFGTEEAEIPDVYLSLPYVIFSQAVALYAAVSVGNNPDKPSPTGTVNRVVQGVIVHEYR